jgi:hypothetical protein
MYQLLLLPAVAVAAVAATNGAVHTMRVQLPREAQQPGYIRMKPVAFLNSYCCSKCAAHPVAGA